MTSATVQLTFVTSGSGFEDLGLWSVTPKSLNDTASFVVSISNPEEYGLSGKLGTTKNDVSSVYDLSDRLDGNTSDTSDEGENVYEKAGIVADRIEDDKEQKVICRFSTNDGYFSDDSAPPSPPGTPVGQQNTFSSLDLDYVCQRLNFEEYMNYRLEEYVEDRQDLPKLEISCDIEVSTDFLEEETN
ncbi:hypothetical protein QCA50_004709 [Cerrena zonata]|uniref:Uncharacterized protein n=1 Tax=Cerrena zonata TaxID=2478898 RepID=A0AAW0GQ11_9APHY